VTVSIGVAIGGTPDGTENVERLVDCADRALLWAKSGGRNQVTFGQSAA
jgi:GGDEF domain-containing protein